MSRLVAGLLRSLLPPREVEPTPAPRRSEVPLTPEGREREASHRKINRVRAEHVVTAALAVRCREHGADAGEWCTRSIVRGVCGARVETGQLAWLDPSTSQVGDVQHLKGRS